MKLTDITPAPWNTRTAITDESVRSLAASMEADGLIQPISVCDSADGDGYICYDGNRRLAAAKLLGWTNIDANYDPAITPDEAKVRTVTANLQRDDDDPLLAAGVIAALLDDGLDAGRIAAKLGKTAAWVNRRRKMIGAADALKACANKVTVEALERVAVLPEKVQAAVCKEIERKAKYMGRIGYAEIKDDIELEMRALGAAKFDTAPCAECPKRTGAEADLFGVADGGLGECLDCKCFEKRRKAWEDAEIARLVGDAEVVKVGYQGELDSMRDGKAKRDKKHPCAYVYTGGVDGIAVKWGESAKAKKAREDAERKATEAERAARNADRDRAKHIAARLKDVCSADGDEYKPGLVNLVSSLMAKNAPQPAVEFVTSTVLDSLDSWHSNEEWCEIIEAFPALLAAAKISESDAAWFRDYAKED